MARRQQSRLFSRNLIKMDKRRTIIVLLVVILSHQLVVMPGGAEIEERKAGIASCHLRELELCALGSISMFQNPKGIPVAPNEFQRQCEYLRESDQCFQDYRDNCMTKIQSSLLDTFATQFGAFEQEFCTNGTRMNSVYMKHANCFRQVQKKYQRPCLADLQVGFEAIHKIPHSARIPTSCCNLKKMEDCILPQIEQSCGKEALEFVEDLMKRAIGRSFHVTCRNFNPNSSACKELLPRLKQKPHNGRNTSAISRAISGFANSHTM